MLDNLKKETLKMINSAKLLIGLLLSFLLFIITYYYLPEFVAIVAGIFVPILNLCIVAWADTAVLGLNTIQEIKKGNIAYGLVFLSESLLIGFGQLTVYLVFIK